MRGRYRTGEHAVRGCCHSCAFSLFTKPILGGLVEGFVCSEGSPPSSPCISIVALFLILSPIRLKPSNYKSIRLLFCSFFIAFPMAKNTFVT